ncbi:Pectate lyase A [Colletotrichum higginsianum IMI 349063]|uniref:Pectate lyase n=2 Tax=Colletotrichum higginsianum TaxID=80884 RepID=A0A1B7YQV7_COLHI|nr:Pectate lyase A [Colletotrichum higginsianum IMI 349063]OBR14421.1 Pectate lyase A [Colletotrichum higginsianum IMI 349063]TID01837.1 putative pectate lyase D [Colletotrichum higginsianum]
MYIRNNLVVLALCLSVLASPASKSGSHKGSSKGGKHSGSGGAHSTHPAHAPKSTSTPGYGAGSGSAAGNGTTSGGGGGANTELQTTFPTPKGAQNLAAVKTIAAGQSFDGGMQLWDRSPSTCKGQSEGGNKDAVFILEEGSTLSNVVIGPNNGEGIHCLGSCTLNNVWFQKVCEDAVTFKQQSGTSFVNGGGAQDAADKVLQHNGSGTVAVRNYFCKNCSKLYRSCGNCKTQTARHATFDNIRLDGGKVLAGVNGNLGDVAEVRDSCVLGADVCDNFEGNSSGAEPKLVSKGPDGKVCVATNVKTTGC